MGKADCDCSLVAGVSPETNNISAQTFARQRVDWHSIAGRPVIDEHQVNTQPVRARHFRHGFEKQANGARFIENWHDYVYKPGRLGLDCLP
jgi:hypothetical protein